MTHLGSGDGFRELPMSGPKAPDFTEHTVGSRTVYEGRLLRVLEDAVRLPDGRSSAREYIRHPGAVMVVALTEADNVVLVRQYRYALRTHFIEIPAGKMEPGEAPLDTARRELREECSLEAASWERLATVHPCIGYSDERIELYLARGLTRVGSGPEEGEFLQCLELGLDEALRRVREGAITDIKSIIGLMWAERRLRGDWPPAPC
jgi:ADP-ribose pyrophosphatase